MPEMIVHFDVSRERSIAAIQQAMVEEQEIFLVAQKSIETENPGQDDVYEIGTVASVKQLIKLSKKVVRVLVEGKNRAVLKKIEETDPYLRAEVEVLEEQEITIPDDLNAEAMMRGLKEIITEYAAKNGKISKESVAEILDITDLKRLVNEVAANIPLKYKDQQELLEELDFWSRYEKLSLKLVNEMQIMEIKEELQRKVKNKVDKHQKEYLLREQLKVIREELGEDTTFSDADEFEEACSKLDAPEEVKEKLHKEIGRFKNTIGSQAENGVIRTYIETILEMPWNKRAEDNTDINYAKEVLEADHYGLEQVKERILEFLAVRTLTQKGESPILCLVGPPGTGKTSIAKSLARSLKKPFVRISLGGVRDEAEIRGHRKTYVGAMPGRIAEGIRQAGVKNPLMLLDEVDKVSSDYKGDTASALLEVLDGEQNVNFRDHYLEVPLDLSEVFFIATANDLTPIPKPLRDRMEIIELSSYTENEKFHIAENYLVKKQRKLSGLTKKQVSISDEVIREVIHFYTREAGVRNLERTIGQLMHKAARKIVEGEEKVDIKKKSLKELLGPAPFEDEDENLKPQIGVVRGLAWTSVGGDTLSIEVNVMPGKGKMELTGCMGDVMKESAQIGLSYVRSIAENYGIDSGYFEKHDIHLHIPEGAVPKDGPSAGITMALAILSAITGIPVRGDIAMTGEITLRGKVLPIGGLKEKLLAAKTVGVKEVLVPARNKRNVVELDEEITDGMKITYVEDMNEVIEHAMKK